MLTISELSHKIVDIERNWPEGDRPPHVDTRIAELQAEKKVLLAAAFAAIHTEISKAAAHLNAVEVLYIDAGDTTMAEVWKKRATFLSSRMP